MMRKNLLAFLFFVTVSPCLRFTASPLHPVPCPVKTSVGDKPPDATVSSAWRGPYPPNAAEQIGVTKIPHQLPTEASGIFGQS
ncbi:MAG: hypothetical protein SQA66_15195 [Candidatus Fervidibacter sacchari]